MIEVPAPQPPIHPGHTRLKQGFYVSLEFGNRASEIADSGACFGFSSYGLSESASQSRSQAHNNIFGSSFSSVLTLTRVYSVFIAPLIFATLLVNKIRIGLPTSTSSYAATFNSVRIVGPLFGLQFFGMKSIVSAFCGITFIAVTLMTRIIQCSYFFKISGAPCTVSSRNSTLALYLLLVRIVGVIYEDISHTRSASGKWLGARSVFPAPFAPRHFS